MPAGRRTRRNPEKDWQSQDRWICVAAVFFALLIACFFAEVFALIGYMVWVAQIALWHWISL